MADGKSHGFIMFLDWSGSMSNCMSKTIDQLMLLALFCKKAGIPFDCFAFANHYFNKLAPKPVARESRYDRSYYPGKVKEFAVTSQFKLLHLVSSQLNNQKFTKAMIYLTYLRESFENRYSYKSTGCNLPNELCLGGTPLNEAIMAAFPMIPLFRKKYNVQIVNTVFLTDGAGASLRAVHRTPTEEDSRSIEEIDVFHGTSIITDMVTKKNYTLDKYGNDTGLLLEILKDRTDCRVTGFFINTEAKRNLHANLRCVRSSLTYEEIEQIFEDLKKNQFARMECQGYEEFYVIDGKKMGATAEALVITDDMTKAKMKTAFIKNRTSKLVSKKMLSQFAEFVS